jgi:hypothetical protein
MQEQAWIVTVTAVCGYIVCLFLAALAVIILWKIHINEIDLSLLLSEANKQASMSRLQLLIFTFVIAISLFMLVEKDGKAFPTVPDGVLTLLGISASTYAVGKGISYSREEGVTPPAQPVPAPQQPAPPQQQQQQPQQPAQTQQQ